MTQRVTRGAIVFLATAAVAASTYAADYSTMTTEELSKLRGTLYNATEQERNTFRHEWQKRVQQMTPEEQAKYLGQGKGPGKGQGYGSGQGAGPGTGMGGQKGKGKK